MMNNIVTPNYFNNTNCNTNGNTNCNGNTNSSNNNSNSQSSNSQSNNNNNNEKNKLMNNYLLNEQMNDEEEKRNVKNAKAKISLHTALNYTKNWYNRFVNGALSWWIVKDTNQKIYACAGLYHDQYKNTIETTILVHGSYQNKGLGKAILFELYEFYLNCNPTYNNPSNDTKLLITCHVNNKKALGVINHLVKICEHFNYRCLTQLNNNQITYQVPLSALLQNLKEISSNNIGLLTPLLTSKFNIQQKQNQQQQQKYQQQQQQQQEQEQQHQETSTFLS
jgi:GNAT superfamily N-acetyltransferase